MLDRPPYLRVAALAAFLFVCSANPAPAQVAGDPAPAQPDNVYDAATKTQSAQKLYAPRQPAQKYRGQRAPLPEDAADAEAERAKSAAEREAAEAKAAAARRANEGFFQTGNAGSFPRLYVDAKFSLDGLLNAGLAPYAMGNNAFNAPAGSVNAGLPANPGWGEVYVQPGFTAKYKIDRDAYLYGGFSFIESGTIGNDYSGAPARWYGLPEQLYAGFHLSHLFATTATLDGSYGQQDYTNGSGMLVWSGATNGSLRGAAYLGPRSAWREAGLLKVADGDYSGQFFYLRPNEENPSFTNTSLTGVNIVWNPPGQLRLGGQYIYALSNIVTRTQMSTYEIRARLHPFKSDPNFWLQGDYALQGKPQLSADGWMTQGSYNFTKLWWQPLVSIGYYSMSANNPANAVIWNGFDPLYFGNGVATWLPGIALQTTLANTNQNIFATTVALNPSASGSLQLDYIDASVERGNAVLAPLSPGVAPPASGGLLLPGYGQEIGASYTWTLNSAVSLNPFAAYVIPGSGITQSYTANGGTAKDWSFFGVSLTVSY
jgi:hypothetical protein